MSEGSWPVEHLWGSAAAFHARDIPDPATAALWWFEVERPAVVLGSTQRDAVIDAVAASAAGVEVARRRSGGGAVYLAPGGALWIDVILPADDARWDRDVGRAFGWLGRAWVEVVHQLGLPGAIAHEGPLQRRPWSDLVCFAGLGPGEVTVGDQKVVGISQRRTRSAARFQCALLQRWDPAPLVEVLALEPDQRERATADLQTAGRGVGPVSGEDVIGRLRVALAATD